jgi:hypothetical protein
LFARSNSSSFFALQRGGTGMKIPVAAKIPAAESCRRPSTRPAAADMGRGYFFQKAVFC